MRSAATSAAREALDWLSLTITSIGRPPTPSERTSAKRASTKSSGSAKKASAPDLGVTKPTRIGSPAARAALPRRIAGAASVAAPVARKRRRVVVGFRRPMVVSPLVAR
jgi:hypothetical protein